MTTRILVYSLLLTLWPLNTYSLSLSANSLFGNKAAFTIELKDNKSLRTLLEDELNLQRQSNPKLKDLKQTNKVGLYERDLLIARLRAQGYYSGRVKFTHSNEQISYKIEPGPLYRISELKLKYQKDLNIPKEVLGITEGNSLTAVSILTAKKNLADYAAAHYCMRYIDANYDVAIDRKIYIAKVTFELKESPLVNFGKIDFTGLTSIDQEYLQDRLPFKEGECFKRIKIDSARLSLIQTDLLASVEAATATITDNTVPITIKVVERHHKTITAGIGFDTDEGFGLSAGWEHRNLMGRGQRFSVDSHVAKNDQRLSFLFTIPHFKKDTQTIRFYSDIERQDTDAFQSKTGSVGVQFTRTLRHKLAGTLGTELAFSEVNENDTQDTFALFSIPVTLEYDKRDVALDPHKGWVLSGQIQPYIDTLNSNDNFLKSTLASSIYLELGSSAKKPVLAVRTALGSITGSGLSEVPANIRFYSGGGGSVRGYPFQTASALTGHEPDGGLSFLELSVETRYHWSENWGGVLFLDGGFAYKDTSPDWGKSLLWGAGIGVRYFTSFAPIRFDIALPLDKREGIDDSFQLYISIGQAF